MIRNAASSRVAERGFRLGRCLFLLSGALRGLLGCSGDTLNGPPPPPPAQTYWALTLNQHAVNLALTTPYDTVQLRAAPFNALGDTLRGLGAVTYSATDSSVVSITAGGLVTAKGATDSTSVIASLTSQGVTLADTVVIQITATVPMSPVTTFSLQPAPDDSAKRSITFLIAGYLPFRWGVYAVDAQGDVVCDRFQCQQLVVSYSTSDPQVARVSDSRMQIFAYQPGVVTFYATALYYGHLLQDSVVFTVLNPLASDVFVSAVTSLTSLTPSLQFAPSTTHIAIGGTVSWVNPFATTSIDVVFDNPTNVQAACSPAGDYIDSCDDPTNGNYYPPTGSGDIPAFHMVESATASDDNVNGNNGTGAVRARRFPVAGVYHFHSALYPNAAGVIIVNDSV